MSTATQRKAWNEAMRSAGAVIPGTAAGSSGAAGASSRRGGGGVASRAADRRRNRRRDKARKSSAYGGVDGGGASSLEEREYRVALHMDILEGVTDSGAAALGDDDDEYDEFADLDDDSSDEGGGTKSKSKKKRKRKGASASGGKKGASSVPKYLKARSLASILMEEASRSDSVARQYVDASVRRLGAGSTSTTTTNNATTARQGEAGSSNANSATRTTYKNPYPARKFCPVTGLFGEYTEPKTGIPYATLSALEQIRERPPPWMNAGNGTASYWEAVKSLQNNG